MIHYAIEKNTPKLSVAGLHVYSLGFNKGYTVSIDMDHKYLRHSDYVIVSPNENTLRIHLGNNRMKKESKEGTEITVRFDDNIDLKNFRFFVDRAIRYEISIHLIPDDHFSEETSLEVEELSEDELRYGKEEAARMVERREKLRKF